MKIAWIAPNGGNYTLSSLKGTGGWISSLESALIENYNELELGIFFVHNLDHTISHNDRVTYVPIYTGKQGNFSKFIERLFNKEDYRENRIAKQIADEIHKFKPDIVHIWGCENYYAKAIKYLADIPCVVHIQGLATPYLNSYHTYGISENQLSSCDSFIDRCILKRGNKYDYKAFKHRVKNEQEVAKYVKNWIGRTQWDKDNSFCLAPSARYYHCEELMRDDFYKHYWSYHYKEKLVIQSSISNLWYKGIDIVLKTAKILTELGINYEWNIYGLTDNSKIVKFFARYYNINLTDVSIRWHGQVNGEKIMEGLLYSDVYVHPSYIENSSNAIAEAMCLGVPVIANFSGGTPSMLKNDSGILSQINDPASLACNILKMRDESTAKYYSSRARALATSRHNKKDVTAKLIYIYQDIIGGL